MNILLSLGHNKVNKRLRNEELTNDPAWPKVPFPTKEQCDSCVRQVDENGDAKEFDENETYKFLKNSYSFQSTARQKNAAIHVRSNRLCLVLFVVLCFLSLEK